MSVVVCAHGGAGGKYGSWYTFQSCTFWGAFRRIKRFGGAEGLIERKRNDHILVPYRFSIGDSCYVGYIGRYPRYVRGWGQTTCLFILHLIVQSHPPRALVTLYSSSVCVLPQTWLYARLRAVSTNSVQSETQRLSYKIAQGLRAQAVARRMEKSW